MRCRAAVRSAVFFVGVVVRVGRVEDEGGFGVGALKVAGIRERGK